MWRNLLDDARVRLAFNLATDRQAIVEKVTKGGQAPARYFTPPGTGGFYPEDRFRFDPQKNHFPHPGLS